MTRDGVIFGVKKFHIYLYGRVFQIHTDHKPLLGLFNEKRAIPAMASPRVQCWALPLAAYDYHIVYKPGMPNANANVLSRLPHALTGLDAQIPGEVTLLMDTMESSPITPMHVWLMTGRDPVLSRVCENIIVG